MSKHKWIFKSRFRARAYSWRGTGLASKRLKEAVSEIRKVTKTDPIIAADGAVSLMERLWPALEHIDTSSGALGTAVYNTLKQLLPILISAPADVKTRRIWLDRLFEAIQEDGVDYLSPVEEQWGEICVFPELMEYWVDQLLPLVRQVWSDQRAGDYVNGDTACLSCLLELGRYEDLRNLLSLKKYRFWHYDKFWAVALARKGLIDEAVTYAKDHREGGYGESQIIRFCEQTLLDSGRRDEAYKKYGLYAPHENTYLGVFKTMARKYPERDSRQVLLDLIETRGHKGKWFAAAKSAGFLDIALECASLGSTEPKTLIRAARDYIQKEPEFAASVALQAIIDLLAGKGYEPTTLDLLKACDHFLAASEHLGQKDSAVKTLLEVLQKAEMGPCDKNMCDALCHRLEG